MALDTTTLINQAQSFAGKTRDEAVEALDRMRGDVSRIGFTTIGYAGVNLPDSPDIPDALVAPVLDPVDLTLPSEPADVTQFQDISPIEVGVIPELKATTPTLVLPTLPAPLAEFTQTAPEIATSFDLPTAPDALDIEILAPSLTDRAEPMAPTISLPSFDAIGPTADLTAPSDLAAQYVAAYRDMAPQFVTALEARMNAMLLQHNPRFHVQRAALDTQLERYLAGGTGLSADVEDAIYERAKDKEIAEARRTSRAAFANAAARGFTIPDGAAFSQDARARQAAADNLARSANEIAIKQAEREQQNLQWAVSQLTERHNSALSAALTYHGSLVALNGQALQAAQAILGAAVEVFNLSIRAFEARLGAYQAEAAVFDTRLKAAMSLRDLYESEIRALQALSEVDRTKVSLYKGKIEALEALAGVYKSRIEAVVQEANLERLKLDLHKSKIEAFAAQAQVKESEYRGYTAAISGQESLVRLYSAQVEAHNSVLAGARLRVDAQSEVVRATALTNQARATQDKAVMDRYSAVVDARARVATTQIESRRQIIQTWEAQARATIATAELQSTVYQSQVDAIIKDTALQIEVLIKGAELNLAQTKALATMGGATAKVYGDLSASALAGQNTLVSQTLQE